VDEGLAVTAELTSFVVQRTGSLYLAARRRRRAARGVKHMPSRARLALYASDIIERSSSLGHLLYEPTDQE